MDDFVSDTDSDYTSYWRDWVSAYLSFYDEARISSKCASRSALLAMHIVWTLGSIWLDRVYCDFLVPLHGYTAGSKARGDLT